jgi:hypothetical protein
VPIDTPGGNLSIKIKSRAQHANNFKTKHNKSKKCWLGPIYFVIVCIIRVFLPVSLYRCTYKIKSMFYKSMFYKSMSYKSIFYKSMFYKSMFYNSMFYKSMFYKSMSFTSPWVLQVHVLQVHVLQVQSIVYKSSPVQGPVHVLQHALLIHTRAVNAHISKQN